MSVPQDTPVGQQAYQASFIKNFAAAWLPFVRTANRYGSGFVNAGGYNGTFLTPLIPLSPVAMVQVRRGGRRVLPVGGNALTLGATTQGTGYSASDTVTLATQNGSRPIVGVVTSVGGGGNILAVNILDPGGGLVAGGGGDSVFSDKFITNVPVASTSGVGTGALFKVSIAYGWGYPQPNPAA